MDDIDQSIRIRAFFQERFSAIALILILLALATGWWAYQVHIVPEFEQEQIMVEEWSESTTLEHSAEITQDSLLWSTGEIVENRPIYYYNLSQELDGLYSYSYRADDGSVDVTTEATLFIRATDDDDIFWEVAEPLASEEESGLSSNQAHNVSFTVEIEWILRTIDRVERETGAQEGLVQPKVEIRTVVDGEVEGSEVSNEYESEMELVVNPDTYRVHEIDTVDESHEESEFRDVPVDPTPTEAIGSIALFIVSIAAFVALLTAQTSGRLELTQEEQELIELQREREEFDDWITTGRFPADRDYEATILVDDLVGVVDVAIDTNNRVIEDTELGVSTVLDNEYVYVYIHPNSPAKDWLVNYADTTLDEFDLR